MEFVFISLFQFFQVADSYYSACVSPPEHMRLNQPFRRMRAAAFRGRFRGFYGRRRLEMFRQSSDPFHAVPLAEQRGTLAG